MIGRGLRPADGKGNCTIIDHSGAVFRHGLPEDHVDWTLDPDRRAEAPAHQARLEHKAAGLLECTQCGALRLGGKPCPNCGFLPQRPVEYVRYIDGELGMVTNGKARAGMSSDPGEWHAMLTYIADERGYKPGWIAHKFKEKFGRWPTSRVALPIEPTPEVLSWVRSRNIAWAKSRERATT